MWHKMVPLALVLVMAPVLACVPGFGSWCNGLAATIVGTSGDDVIVGTLGSDIIHGLGGDDVIYGMGGGDLICGGGGNDTIYGPFQSEVPEDAITLDDMLPRYAEMGGMTAQELMARPEVAAMLNDPGPDIESGGQAILSGGPGNDTVYAGSGQTILNGGEGNDQLLGGPNQNILNGDEGDDQLNGGTGFDICNGGLDTDSFSDCEESNDM